MSEFNKCRREGRIAWGDDFNSLAEVVGLFGIEDPKVLSGTSFSVPGKEDVLCCVLSENCAGGWQYERELGPACDSRGWNETLRYGETNYRLEEQEKLIKSELKAPKTRLVFWRERREGRNWYKFAGVFKLNRKRTEFEEFYGDSWCWYDRVDTVAECPKADWNISAHDTAKLCQLDGRLNGELVKCELLDEVACEDKEGKPLDETALIWPGTILRVVLGARGSQLRCRVQGDERYFLILRRDFELGYFRLLGRKANIDETKMVKSAALERCWAFPSRSEREKVLERIEREMSNFRKILLQKGTAAHKRLVRAILRENDGSAWAFAYWNDDAGQVEFKDIPSGFLEAHAIGGHVEYHGLGHFALFDLEGNFVKLVD